jgi:Polysaccharide lyase
MSPIRRYTVFGALLCTALLLAVLAPSDAPAPVRSGHARSGVILWKADAESAMTSEWASNSSVPVAASPPRPDPSRIAQSAFRAQGKKSYRFKLRDGDDSYGERAELGQAMPSLSRYSGRLFRAGQERWIAMQYYFPTTWPTDDTWQTVMQIKPITPGGGGPSVGFDAGRNRLRFYGNDNTWGSTAGAARDGAGPLTAGSYPITKGRWIKLTWHVVFSADPKVGSLEVFGDLADGRGMRTLVPRRGRATMKYLDGAMDPVHLRVGIYRDPTMTASVKLYVDGLTVATTRAAAEANAYGRRRR